ncbi:MAG: hypothetical protein ACRDRL_17770 [Sciscionella sp.]
MTSPVDNQRHHRFSLAQGLSLIGDAESRLAVDVTWRRIPLTVSQQYAQPCGRFAYRR